MFLSDKDIRKEVKEGAITINDFDEERLQPASYDILLGNKFIITDLHSTESIDPERGVLPETYEMTIKDGDPFVLHPGVSVVGFSKDYFGSDKYLVEVNGKSSLARIGLLVHNSASLINPGHYLNLALELCNLNNVPLILRPGMRIAQLTFSELSDKPEADYKATGRYHDKEDQMNGFVLPKK
ncbi:dCTP deaminase [Patescibacteria group bacterium]|nr:dCTP deaminase [Patescibacteria group bacterium]